MDVKLVCVGGKHPGQEIPVRGPKFFIGRAEDCHLRPGSPQISRHHAVIIVEEGFIAVRDFGSKNGTMVNGEPVHGERELKGGDTLGIGPLEFEVELSVGVGGKKRPKVQSVQEAAARSAAAASYDGDEDIDVAQWFDDEGTASESKDARETRAGEDAASTETTIIRQYRPDPPEEPPKKEEKAEEKKSPAAKKPFGQSSIDSQSAAADTLRKMLGRRF